jgi:hypothetical protein
VVAEQNGTVDMLSLDSTTGEFQVTQVLTALNGTPSDPSALEILESGARLQVVVSSAGLDDLFVFATPETSEPPPAPPLPSPPGETINPDTLLPPPPPVATVLEATAPQDTSLALVLTLMAGALTGGETGAREADNGRPEPLPAPEAEALLAENLSGGDNESEDDGSDAEASPHAGGIGSGADQGLRQLDLYERRTVPDAGEPQSRNTPEAAPALREWAVAAAEATAEMLPSWLADKVRAFFGVSDSLPVRGESEVPSGDTQAAPSPDAPGLTPEMIRESGSPSVRAADPPGPEGTPEVPPGEGVCGELEAVGDELSAPAKREWPAEKEWLLALAVGGVSWHLQQRPSLHRDKRDAAASSRRTPTS